MAATARLVGVSGLVFTALFTFALVLVHRAPALDVANAAYADFYHSGARTALVIAGLYVVPFAGIVFLWHMMATRILIASAGAASADMARALQLASGILFVALLFAGTAAAGSIALLTQFSGAPLPPPDLARALSAAGYGVVFVYGVRVAGMYIITTTKLARAAGFVPRGFAWFSYAVATLLLVSTTFHPAVLLVFPGWVLLTSVLLLTRTGRGRTQAPARQVPGSPTTSVQERSG